MSYYLNIRNRFLTYEHMTRNGVALRRYPFLLNTFLYGMTSIREALQSPKNRGRNVRAVLEGLRDGLHGRFGPPPWLEPPRRG